MVPESLDCNTQEEREGRTERGSRNIKRETSERKRAGEGMGGVGGIGSRGVIRNLTTTRGNKWTEWGNIQKTESICVYC